MNIYSNIINRFFQYKGSTYKVTGHVEMPDNGPTYRTVVNVTTGAETKLSYAQMWEVTPLGYSISNKS
jgi:hypothetical protein